jgi:hypothetical protein
MRYVKPELLTRRDATDAIRGGKGNPVAFDAPIDPTSYKKTTAAYESDE